MSRWALVLIAVGLVLRVLAAGLHDEPRGDVLLDVGEARSLRTGEGFASGFVRGVPVVAGDETPVPPQGHADQHPPLWPLVGALLAPLAGSPFAGLQLGSWLAGLVLVLLTWRCADRLLEGLPGAPDGLAPLAASLVALSFLAIDGAGNGSLYTAQAALLLGLVELLAAPRPQRLGVGLVLGALLMLNHQTLVLVPVPLLTWWLAPPPGRGRAGALGDGLVSLVVAALCCLPWWWRNQLVFGAPLHSVNGLYLLYRAGAEPRLALEAAGPVLRLTDDLGPLQLGQALVGFARSNLLYLLTAGLFVWPGLLGAALVSLPGEGLLAWRRGERRVLALLLSLAALVAVDVLWPGTKLRYLVVLLAPLLLLGLRALARPARPGERRLALLAGLAWLVLLVLTRDDLSGAAEWAQPRRWTTLALGGLGLVVLPTAAWLVGRPRLALVTAGLLAPALSACVLLGPGPGTAYHGTPFLDDAFGQPSEQTHERAWERVRGAHGLLVKADARTVLGPTALLFWERPALVELSDGLPPELSGPALAALLDRDDGPRADHVVLPRATVAALLGQAPLAPGAALLDGRLAVVDGTGDEPDDLLVLEVRPP